jgi:hypothetical protein
MTAFRNFGFVLLALGAGGLAASAAEVYSAPAQGVVLTQTESVIGKEVVSATGERVGRIVDILADETGAVRAAVVDYGGFLGVGTRKIAVAWSDLRFGPGESSTSVATDLARENLSQAPEVKEGRPVVAVSSHDAGGSGSVQN